MSETKPNDIEKLRDILFTALGNLQDGKIDVPKAKAISDVSQTIINSAKVELEFNKGKSSRFFTEPPEAIPEPEHTQKIEHTKHGTVERIGNRTVHTIK